MVFWYAPVSGNRIRRPRFTGILRKICGMLLQAALAMLGNRFRLDPAGAEVRGPERLLCVEEPEAPEVV
jgi:hypothetical protein